jgi:phosphatidylserine/phosphatidylglycerophosphate/cardiolipin synthase-like enzyme
MVIRDEHLASVAVVHVNGAEPVPLASRVTITGVEKEPTTDDSLTAPAPGTSGRLNAETAMVVVAPRPSIERGVAVTSRSGASAGWHPTNTTDASVHMRMRNMRTGYTCTAPGGRERLRDVRSIEAELLVNDELYQRVVLDRISKARESVLIATANVKAMLVQLNGTFRPVADLFAQLSSRGVWVRLLHAELPSRPFRAAFDKHEKLIREGGRGGARMELKLCPRVHFKAVLIDGAWLYVGSANLTGAGLGAKHAHARNFELGLVTEDFDTIDRVSALFESVWTGAECRACRLFDQCPDPIGKGPSKRRGNQSRGGSTGIVLGRSRRISRPR